MEEIKVGEYFRTPYNKIEKVTKIQKEEDTEYYTDDIVFTDKNAYSMKWLKSNEVKHSINIIDLIEEGDIVEYKVTSNSIKVGRVRKYIDARSHEEYLGLEGFKIKEILSIMTKEQFKNGKYNVGNTDKR